MKIFVIKGSVIMKIINAYICIAMLCCVFELQAAPADLFLKRHSGKSYDPSREITLQQMETLIEAARWAPSSHNEQPWRFIFCDKHLTPEAYLKALNAFKDTQKKWVSNAPLLIIVTARLPQRHDNKPNAWAEYDTGSAALSIALQAVDLGLMAHQIGGFDKDKIINGFQLSSDYKPMSIMILGYEGEDPNPKLRTRLPIQENFFWGEWGAAIPLGG
jgi:nitroreductase